MLKINLVLSYPLKINELAFVAPLEIFRSTLIDSGIKINYIYQLEKVTKSDFTIISSHFAWKKGYWLLPNKNKMFDYIEKINKSSKTIWADVGDSTGATHFEILPHVSMYIKSFVLRDRSLYLNKFYGSRIFTDYYHNYFNWQDDNSGEEHLNYIPDSDELNKIKLSWNQAFLNYSYAGWFINRIKSRIPFIRFKNINKLLPPELERNINLNARFGTNHKRKTLANPRKKVKEQLNISDTKRLNKKEYYEELRRSKIVVSPFGWGEICYRDFEAILYGAALFKPDCSHLMTYPSFLINNQTYYSYKWDFSDLNDTAEKLISNDEERIEVAKRAQQIFREQIFSEDAGKLFLIHFLNLIDY